MRLASAASVLSLCALGFSLVTLAAQPDAAPLPAAAPSAAVPSPSPAAGDAAAKHVKRTACLKEAKTKKLIGPEKTAFLKSCIDAPQEPISASRRIPPERP